MEYLNEPASNVFMNIIISERPQQHNMENYGVISNTDNDLTKNKYSSDRYYPGIISRAMNIPT